jgi:hypothetical protein
MNLSQLSGLEFGGLPGAVPCARMHARQVLTERGLDELAHTAELLVSELMTNAVQASLATGEVLSIRLRLYADQLYADRAAGSRYAGGPDRHLDNGGPGPGGPDGGAAQVIVAEVWDLCPEPPVPKESGPVSENGRGLQLVQTLAAEWGWYEPPGWPGKAVWCLIMGAA